MTASAPVVVITGLYIYGRALISGCLVLLTLIWWQLKSPKKWLPMVKRRDVPPKSLLNEELGQHGYVNVEGLKIHYVEKGDRSKPLILFVHGFPEFWYSWRYQMKEFSKDYWTVAIDMRGYGDSDKPARISDYSMDLLVDDIKQVVTRLGRKKFILVAHDWGAIIGWTFVDQYPEMIEKYIMLNGPHPKVFEKIAHSPQQIFKSWYVYFFQLPILPEIYSSWADFAMLPRLFLSPKESNPYITEDDLEAFRYTFSKPGSATPPINYYRALMRNRMFEGIQPKFEKVIQKTRPKGLYIFGANDLAIDISNVKLHKDHFEHLESVIIPEGNHFIQQDEPLAVNKAMRSFLDK